ncbi:uncharacterized protein PgNI_12294 [Pyricularia grisea]|uniref:Ribonuclease H1 N-terminal domain-containing protein n=1 Tax=Pyricularia grisea TaxID=148305 RepID=A0A6P8AN28_PYRGI|nr:uncharacterized protein PgNI_12294 [Pyricularia grisea]TLD03429.1 hypothetical protein PgNI_12294 [Pyricularia grisea]
MAPKKSKRKDYYAIKRGRFPPMITTCWFTAHSQVNGFPGNDYKGFSTFWDAKEYMQHGNDGHATFHFHACPTDVTEAMAINEKGKHHAFISGNQSGVVPTYREVQKMVHGVSGASHKSFGTEECALAFLTAGLASILLAHRSPCRSAPVRTNDNHTPLHKS